MDQPILPAESDLFGDRAGSALPPGFRYEPGFLAESEQQVLVDWISTLPLTPFEFRGFQGKRRVASFGWRYDYHRASLHPAPPLAGPLLALRDRAAIWAGLDPSAIQQSLVAEYAPGAPIGWHTDRPQFDQVLGISLLAPTPLRLRRRHGSGWERRSVLLESRSIYLLSGEVRREWQHSIPPLRRLRYSITLRCLRADLACETRARRGS
jgi:alkylated DNA repair dioxygenase AlkB